jgi:hypothetical protein
MKDLILNSFGAHADYIYNNIESKKRKKEFLNMTMEIIGYLKGMNPPPFKKNLNKDQQLAVDTFNNVRLTINKRFN